MRVTDALSQIARIHDHLARAEQYRGFRPAAVALSGIVGLVAALIQPWFVAADNPIAFVRYWLIVAAVGGGIGISPAVDAFVWREDSYARKRTMRVVGQFSPCVAAGFGATMAIVKAESQLTPFLPGLWTVVFALGVFSARPYLPRAIGWVGLYYLTAGIGLLSTIPANLTWAGVAVGVVFAAGQVATAAVLHRNRERNADA